MKIDKLKDVYNKINTDASMDKKIKEKLLYYDPQTESMKRKKQYIRTDYKGSVLSFIRAINKLSVVKAALPSIAFLVFMVIIVFSIKARMENDLTAANSPSSVSDTQDPDSSVETTNPETVNIISVTPAGETVSAQEENSVSASEPEVTDPAGTEVTDSTGSSVTDSTGAEITETTGTDGSNLTEEAIVQSDASSEQQIDNSDNSNTEEASQASGDAVKAYPGEFYFASFDVINENDVKAAIPNLVIRLHGKVDSIDPSDLTDIVLTLNGVQVDNGVTLTDRVEQFNWRYEEITDFYFKFDYENRDPGIYGLKGAYKGEAFTVYNKIIEAAITEEPAAEENLSQVGWGYYTDKNEKPQKVTELVFHFSGIQNAFYQSDLTELKVTLNGNEITYSFMDRVFRYLEYNGVNGGDTSYNLVLNEAYTQSGTYVVTGKYRGKSFTSQEIIIP